MLVAQLTAKGYGVQLVKGGVFIKTADEGTIKLQKLQTIGRYGRRSLKTLRDRYKELMPWQRKPYGQKVYQVVQWDNLSEGGIP